MFQSLHYNMINHTMPQISTKSHNKMTMSHHQIFNEAWNNIFPKQRNQRKTHIDVQVGIWSMGLRVLKEPLPIIPFKWWVIFLAMRSKKRGSIGRTRHVGTKKMEVLKIGFTKNGCIAKVVKNTRILNDINGDEWRKVEKLRKVFFLRRNGEMKKKNQVEEEGE